MRTRYTGGLVWDGSSGCLAPLDICTENGTVVGRGSAPRGYSPDRTVDLSGLAVFPGFADVHVHLREPGFSYKETIASGSRACARGGYTDVCAMPNLNPVPDSPGHLAAEEALIARDAVINVHPYGAITRGQRGEGELVDMAALAPRVCGFSDDGRGVKEAETMRQAMLRCREADSILSAHCEDVRLIPAGAGIHDGRYARLHGLPGIPSESEYGPVLRDIALCRETGCRYHVCHVSTKEAVDAIRAAKAEGADITCETAPHYLLLCEDDLPDEPDAPRAGWFKMNPPLRSKADQDALLEGLLDGTIDCIATDHAPHGEAEKAKGLAGSAMGISGIEIAFPLLYTHLTEIGLIPLDILMDRLCVRPRRRFRLPGGLEPGDRLALTAFDLHVRERVEPDRFLSGGKATPFAGWPLHAACRLTVTGERFAWNGLS